MSLDRFLRWKIKGTYCEEYIDLMTRIGKKNSNIQSTGNIHKDYQNVSVGPSYNLYCNKDQSHCILFCDYNEMTSSSSCMGMNKCLAKYSRAFREK